MRQRAVIAMSMTNDPDVIIADEPTTALDVTVQAQVLDTLRRVQENTSAGIVLITHDLGVVAGMAHRVLVMYAGKPVEIGETDDIYYDPRMPYTLGLLGSLPRLDQTERRAAHPDPGGAAVAGQPAPGLPVLAPLPDEPPPLRRRGAGAAVGDRRRPRRRLPLRRGAGRGRRRRRGVRDRRDRHPGRRAARPARPPGARPRPSSTGRSRRRSAHDPDHPPGGPGRGRRRQRPHPRGHQPGQALPADGRGRGPAPDRRRPRGLRPDLPPGPGRDPRAGRRVGLRQVDHRQGHPPAQPADLRVGQVRGRGAGRQDPQADAERPPRPPGGVPGPVRLAQPADPGQRHRGRAARHPRAVQAPGHGSGSGSC